MLNYLKYEKVFEEYKRNIPELEGYNIITYLTSIILNKGRKTCRNFGLHFCAECASYFTNNPSLLKNVYWAQYEMDSHFDYDGNELRAILDLDRAFIHNSLKEDIIGLGYSSVIRLSKINTSILWEYPEYEELIEDLLLIIEEKKSFFFLIERDILSLFSSQKNSDLTEKMKLLILKLSHKYSDNDRIALILIEVVYANFRDWFIEYYRYFLLLNRDIEITKNISFSRSSSITGSWVPVYQKKIEFYQEIIKMINSLPNILDYSEHIDFFEQKIVWKRMDIEREMKRDFMDEYY